MMFADTLMSALSILVVLVLFAIGLALVMVLATALVMLGDYLMRCLTRSRQ